MAYSRAPTSRCCPGRSVSRNMPRRPCSRASWPRRRSSGTAIRRRRVRRNTARLARAGSTRRYRLARRDDRLASATCWSPTAPRRRSFFVAQLAVPQEKAGGTPTVLMPNPYYNVYNGGATAGRRRAGLSRLHEGDRLPARSRRDSREACWRAARSSISAARPIRKARSPTSPISSRRSRSPAPTISFSRSTNAIARSTTARRRPARSRLAPRWAARSTTCWSSIRSRSARTPPACAAASSPAIRI